MLTFSFPKVTSTLYVSGSTLMVGKASFNFMSVFDMLLQFFTGSTRFLSPYFPPTPCSAAIALTNAMLDAAAADPWAPNIGLMITGCGVGMLAFASPI